MPSWPAATSSCSPTISVSRAFASCCWWSTISTRGRTSSPRSCAEQHRRAILRTPARSQPTRVARRRGARSVGRGARSRDRRAGGVAGAAGRHRAAPRSLHGRRTVARRDASAVRPSRLADAGDRGGGGRRRRAGHPARGDAARRAAARAERRGAATCAATPANSSPAFEVGRRCATCSSSSPAASPGSTSSVPSTIRSARSTSRGTTTSDRIGATRVAGARRSRL